MWVFLNTGSDDWVRATARPGKEAWGRVWAGEVERPLVLKLGLELGQVTRCITRRVADCTVVLFAFI